MQTPKELGFYFPAEFALQRALWLSWPHKEESWPGKIQTIYNPYCEFILQVAENQKVCVNVIDESMKSFALTQLRTCVYANKSSNLDFLISQITFYFHPTNDAWCRDHGPSFLLNHNSNEKQS